MKLQRCFAALSMYLAATTAVPAGQSVERSERWSAALAETQSVLESGDAKRARRMLAALLRDVLDTPRPSEESDERLGQVLTQLALAEAGDGAAEDAIWHWHIAQNVDRSVAHSDLSRYGGSGATLLANVLAPAPTKCAQPPGAPSSPTIRERGEPKRPKAAVTAGLGGIVIVQVEVDANGRPVRPQVLLRPPGLLEYGALEALREFRFNVTTDAGDVPVCMVFKFG